MALTPVTATSCTIVCVVEPTDDVADTPVTSISAVIVCVTFPTAEVVDTPSAITCPAIFQANSPQVPLPQPVLISPLVVEDPTAEVAETPVTDSL